MTLLRRQLHEKIAQAKFPFGQRKTVEDILVQAVCHFRIYRNRLRKNLAPLPGKFQLRSQAQKRGPKDKKRGSHVFALSDPLRMGTWL